MAAQGKQEINTFFLAKAVSCLGFPGNSKAGKDGTQKLGTVINDSNNGKREGVNGTGFKEGDSLVQFKELTIKLTYRESVASTNLPPVSKGRPVT